MRFLPVYNEGVVRQVAQTIAKYGMFRPGERVGVAVSGGADSVALLHVLRELADELGIALAAVHLNHGLRGRESGEDEDFVATLAAEFGVKLFSKSVNVAEEAQKAGENLEQVGRKRRYQWFTQLLEQGLVDKIAVAHTQSDQAETVLYRLLRGAGSAGLSGIRPVLAGRIVRPLIEVSREQVLACLEAGNHRWREDLSNRNECFARNRLRRKLMPLLTKEWNPNLPAVLSRLAEWAQGEEDYWRETVRDLTSRCLEKSPQGVFLQADAVKSLPPAAQRRLLRAAIEEERGNLLGINFEHVESVRRVVGSSHGKGRVRLPGLDVTRSFDQVRLAAAEKAMGSSTSHYSLDLAPPGTFSIPGDSKLVVLKLYDRGDLKQGYNEERQGLLDWERVPKPLRLRNWRAGDNYHPQGRGGAKKLKSLFQESRIAVWERTGWPIIAAPERLFPEAVGRGSRTREVIVWARGFGASADFEPREDSRVILEISEVDPEAGKK